MDIVTLFVWFALIGILAYVLCLLPVIDAGVKRIIQLAAVVICVLILLQALGLLQGLGTVPRLR